jgi:putative ABC transport system substrate-binding protein
VKRREFITLIGGAAAWPLGARAQQAALPVIGFLNSGSASGREPLVAAFNRGLSETGYFGDRNAVIEYRWAEGKYDRLPALAEDLIRRRVAVIAATGGIVAPLSAQAATTTIPIVGVFDADPVAAGLVDSLNRPGQNLTGVSLIASVIEAKQLELLRELAPTAGVVALLINPSNPNADTISKNLQAAASTLGLQLHVLTASTERDFDTVSTALAQLRVSALIFATDPFFFDHRSQLIALTMRLALPGIFGRREYVVEGGLVSYGTSLSDAYRQIGAYAGQILKGAKPADLPVTQPTKFELVINLKTAKSLDVKVPQTLQVAADEVIE